MPTCLDHFGNTSSASIPLTIVDQREALDGKDLTLVCCGFGVGLSWGTCRFRTDGMKVSPLVEVADNGNGI